MPPTLAGRSAVRPSGSSLVGPTTQRSRRWPVGSIDRTLAQAPSAGDRARPAPLPRGCGYLISGSCADVFKNAVVGLHELGLPLVNFIHDEVIVECDVDQAPQVAAALGEIMTRDVGPVRGLHADASIPERWSDFKRPGYVP